MYKQYLLVVYKLWIIELVVLQLSISPLLNGIIIWERSLWHCLSSDICPPPVHPALLLCLDCRNCCVHRHRVVLFNAYDSPWLLLFWTSAYWRVFDHRRAAPLVVGEQVLADCCISIGLVLVILLVVFMKVSISTRTFKWKQSLCWPQFLSRFYCFHTYVLVGLLLPCKARGHDLCMYPCVL